MISPLDTNHNRKTAVCCLLFVFLLQLPVSVGAFNLRKIKEAQNLSSSRIRTLHPDEKGLLWIGTARGLDTYDGKRVVPYGPADNPYFFTGAPIEKIKHAKDKSVWLQTGSGLYRLDPSGAAVESFPMFNRTAFWDADSRGNLFLIQGNHGIYYKPTHRSAFDQQPMPGLSADAIADFFIDGTDRLWIVEKEGTLRCFSLSFTPQNEVDFQPLPDYRLPSNLLYSTHDEAGVLYGVDATCTLFEWDTATRHFLPVCHLRNQGAETDEITSLLKFHEDYFIGFKTQGLFLLKKEEKSYRWQEMEIPAETSCLYKDNNQDMVWIGTWGQGVYTYSNDPYTLRSVCWDDVGRKIRHPVSALFVDAENTLWVGSRGGGIVRIFDFRMDKNIEKHRIDFLTASGSGGSLPDNVIHSFAASRAGNFWIGSRKGLSYVELSTHHIRPVRLDYENQPVENIVALYEQDSSVWVSALGLGVIKAKLQWRGGEPLLTAVKRFAVHVADKEANCFSVFYPEDEATLWWASEREGVFRLNPVTSAFEPLRWKGHAIKEVNALRKDKDGGYLIGTGAGLARFRGGTYQKLRESGTFPAYSVYGILPDEGSGYWLSTNRGLLFYDALTASMRAYDHRDGLSVVEFNAGASFEDKKNNLLFFGGINGFVAIQRNYFDEAQHYMPPIRFTTIRIRDKQYPIERFLRREGKEVWLELGPDQHFFTLSFAAIDHLNGSRYVYAYRWDGEGKEWVSNGHSDAISFAGLPPGRYKLYVKYRHTVLGKESYSYPLVIRIRAPWYASGWAYGLYGILLLAGTGLGLYGWNRYARKKRTDQLQRIEQKHKEEIYESKLRFFTNISHEFCTPLTLISAPCHRLMEQKNLTASAKKYATVIQQNARRLHGLIQELIEFDRIESGYKKPVIAQVDVAALVTPLVESFAGAAEARQITVEKEFPPSLIWPSDKDFLVTIVLNLLSNAFKYAAGKKQVKVRIGAAAGALAIEVSNTGKGIAAKDIPVLFDRYRTLQHLEQNEPGGFHAQHGLGLAIAYQLVRLLEGTIEVESLPDEWTHFRIRLPYLPLTEGGTPAVWGTETAHPVSLPAYRPEPVATWQVPKNNRDELKPTLLVVDDEIEMQWLIFDLFQAEYNVWTASDAKEALERLKDGHPDLIVSDVLMEGMDGLSFSRQVKSDVATAHIPLILLSARGDMEGQTAGLNAGADIYITKPFHVDYLKSSVRRLLERKESLRTYFSSPLSAYTLENGKLSHKEQQAFRREMLKIVHKHIRNKELSASFIAEEMKMGLRTFYRRLEEAGADTLTEVINNCRLAKAADLLVKTNLTIDEIVFQSGFTNRSTFYRSFSKKYACTPTAYRKQQQAQVFDGRTDT